MKKIFTIIIVAVCLMGCSKIDLDELAKQEYGTSLAIPIGQIDASIFDIFQQFDSVIDLKQDADNTVFVYWEQQFSVDEFSIKDFSKGAKLRGSYRVMDIPYIGNMLSVLPAGTEVPLPKGKYAISDTLVYSFKFNDFGSDDQYDIDSILVHNATLALNLNLEEITLDDNNYIELELTFPTLSASRPMTFKAIATQNRMDIERMTGYFIANFGTSANNDVDFYLTMKLVSNGGMRISSNSMIKLATQFTDINMDVLYGYIYCKEPVTSNHTTIELPKVAELQEFITKNKVSLYNPQLALELTTNLGVDAALHVNGLYGVLNDGTHVDALFRGSPSFTKTIETAQKPHTTATTNITIDRTFGGLNELFKTVPDSLAIDWDLYIGTPAMIHNNFLVNPLQLDAKIYTKIPIWFDKGVAINYTDTMDADLTGINGEWTDYAKIKKFNIYLDFENTLPVQADARITFLDSLDHELFTQDNIEIPCPPVDEYGRSKQVVNKTNVLEFTEQAIANILKTKKIMVTYYISGYDEESLINFHATDGLKIKVSAYADMGFSFSKDSNK